MKEKWQAPKIFIQQFVPNDYISTCGKTEYGKYRFKCDAPAGELYYYPNGRGRVNRRGGYEGARDIGNYYPCGLTHETDTTSDFYDGFVDYNNNTYEDPGEAVMVWTYMDSSQYGPFRNGHATKTLGRDQWTTLKS